MHGSGFVTGKENPGVSLGPAIGAVTADFSSRHGDLNLAVLLDLTLHLLEETALHFPYLPATQASNMDVVARAVAFVKMLLTVDVEKVEFVDQAHFLEHVERAINGDAMDLRIDALRALENGAGVEMALGTVHYLKKDTALARETDPALRKSGLQAAGGSVRVDALAAGNSLCVG
jgi:hypothetical protein